MEFPRVGQQTYPRPVKAVTLRHPTTAGAAITLNGGTVTDIAGGIRVTVPSGSTVEPAVGTILRWPLYYDDGTRCRWGDEYLPVVGVREISGGNLPGLSSDTIAQAGIGTEGGDTYMHLAGMHYSAAARKMAWSQKGLGATVTAYAASSSGNERGALGRGEVINEPVTWLRTGRAYGVDYAGDRTVYTDMAGVSWTPKPNATTPIDLILSVRRSAATAGSETIDLIVDVYGPGEPR